MEWWKIGIMGVGIPGLSFLNPTFQYSIIPTFQQVIHSFVEN